jgi:hypothetical protein
MLWNQYLVRAGQVNVWVGILRVQLLRPVVIPNTLSCEVHHHFLLNDLRLERSCNMWLFITDNTCESCMMGHHLILSALSGSTWTKLSVTSGSTGLHDPQNLILWIFDCGDIWRLRCLQRRSMTWRYCCNEERMPLRSFEWNQEFSTKCTLLCHEKLKIVLQCIGKT